MTGRSRRASSRYLSAGLVAVVAVGDEDGLGRHQPADGGVRFLVGHDPEPVLDAEMIGRHEGSAIAQPRLERAVNLFGRCRDRARKRD